MDLSLGRNVVKPAGREVQANLADETGAWEGLAKDLELTLEIIIDVPRVIAHGDHG